MNNKQALKKGLEVGEQLVKDFKNINKTRQTTISVLKVYPSFILGICQCGCGEQLENLRDSRGRLKYYKWGHNRQGVKYSSKLKNKGKPRLNWNGYITLKKNGKYRKLHRLIYEEYHNCCLLPYTELDHINEDKLDNRIENLRPLYKSPHAKISSIQKKKKLQVHKRVCLLCKSKKTYFDKKREHYVWAKYEDGWICKKCKQRIWWRLHH